MKYGPGTMWSRNFSEYSITLTPRKTTPRIMVVMIHMIWVRGFSPVCAERTAKAMVNELKIRTAVLKAPSLTSRWALASWKPIGSRER